MNTNNYIITELKNIILDPLLTVRTDHVETRFYQVISNNLETLEQIFKKHLEDQEQVVCQIRFDSAMAKIEDLKQANEDLQQKNETLTKELDKEKLVPKSTPLTIPSEIAITHRIEPVLNKTQRNFLTKLAVLMGPDNGYVLSRWTE